MTSQVLGRGSGDVTGPVQVSDDVKGPVQVSDGVTVHGQLPDTSERPSSYIRLYVSDIKDPV
jgi:hypothetical protein